MDKFDQNVDVHYTFVDYVLDWHLQVEYLLQLPFNIQKEQLEQ